MDQAPGDHDLMTLADFVAELADLDDQEKLEFLVELAEELPALSAARRGMPFPATCRVQECQTAVHLWTDVVDGRVQVEADVPKNSPTVRGLVTLVLQVVNGRLSNEVLALPEDWLPVLGLQAALGMTRQNGLRGVVSRIQRAVREQTAT
jgi:cysteine desulfuration protein SufE